MVVSLLFAAALLWAPVDWVRVVAVALALVTFGGDVLRRISPLFNRLLIRGLRPLLKKEEHTRPIGSTFLMVGIALAVLVLPAQTCAVALLMAGIGDPAASVAGRYWSPAPHRRKSVQGSAAFLACALAAGIGLSLPLGVVVLGAAAAVLVEALPLPVDDNLTVPLACGLAMEAAIRATGSI